jgi:hypothetical protein
VSGAQTRDGLAVTKKISDVARLVEHFRSIPELATASKGDEFHYASVPLCILDAIFSINARYQSVQNVIARYCAHFGVPRTRPGLEFPPPDRQLTVSDLIAQVKKAGLERFTNEILQNRARTSIRNPQVGGIRALRASAGGSCS